MLGWTPYEYYTSSPYEIVAASEGLFDKMQVEAWNLRLASYRIHQSLVTKPVSIEEYWPMDNKKKDAEKSIMTRETYAEIKKAHNLK